jgi:hypothetical protein
VVEHARDDRRPLPAECKARRGARQPEQNEHACADSAREHHNEGHRHQQQQPSDRRRYRYTSSGKGQRDKQQKELQDQQDGQARISEPILPRTRRCSLGVEDRGSQMPMHGGRFCWEHLAVALYGYSGCL